MRRQTISYSAANDQLTTDLTTMFVVQPYIGPERRAFVRLPYRTEATGRTPDAREGIVHVQNVSRIGLRFEAPCLLDTGTPVVLYFGDVYLRDEPVRLNGRVIWSRGSGVWYPTGVALDHTGQETLAAASELFYAAIAGYSDQFAASYARVSPDAP